MYGGDFSTIYDTIYDSRGKDYDAEAAEVMGHIRARRATPGSLLDVACGTGTHMTVFGRHVADVEGLELSEHMIAQARTRLPAARLHHGDMRAFSTGRTYDAVTCMFSSIGYMSDTADLDAAIAAMAAHLTPGGVVVIEPWYFPERFLPGYVARDHAHRDDRVVVRVSHSTRTGDHVPIIAHYLVADPEHGVHHFTDVHRMRLFTRAEYEAAFDRAGCSVDYVPGGRFSCGLFVGVRR